MYQKILYHRGIPSFASRNLSCVTCIQATYVIFLGLSLHFHIYNLNFIFASVTALLGGCICTKQNRKHKSKDSNTPDLQKEYVHREHTTIQEHVYEQAVAENTYIHSEFGRISSYFFHDLITPLNTLTILLSSNHNDPKVTISKCMESCNRINFYINTYRDFSHNLGKSIWFDIKEEIGNIVSLLQTSASLYSVNIHNHVCEYKLFGNKFIFIQIITNVLTNAIDSHKNNQNENKHIDIFMRAHSDIVKIIIKDNGVGIPLEIQDHIFKNTFTNKGNKGSGIGLFNTKIHMKKYFSGHISFISKPNKGTTFFLSFSKKPIPDAHVNVRTHEHQSVHYLF